MNNYIIRTRKFSKLKIPYLKITSLSSNKKAKKEENFIKWNKTQKDINYNFIKKNKNNDKINNFKNKFEKIYGNIINFKDEKMLNEEMKLKSLISNNITIISKKFFNPTNAKVKKTMKDDQTNTEPILEEINTSSQNLYNNNYIEIKKQESNINIASSLKKKLNSFPDYLVQSEKIINQTLNAKKEESLDSNLKNKRLFSSNLKNVKKDEEDYKQYSNITEKGNNENEIRNLKKNKTNDNFINNINKKENNYLNKIYFGDIYNKSFRENKNQNKDKKYHIRNRNIITAINYSKSKDMENQNYNHQITQNLLNENFIIDYKKIINKGQFNEELKKNSLFFSEDIKKNKTKFNSSNKLYNLRPKNIKFSPCRYNLFNVPVLENNNSIEETIKQQTVSNFNNKYNLKYKTKNPKEKEKIKTLFNMIKKHKNYEFQRKRDIKKYNSIKNKFIIYLDDNKQMERPKTGNINMMKINNKYINNKKLDNYINKKTYNMISVKTMNFLEGQF